RRSLRRPSRVPRRPPRPRHRPRRRRATTRAPAGVTGTRTTTTPGRAAKESSGRLAVVPDEVVQSRGRWLVAEAAVGSSVVVAGEVGLEGGCALGVAAVDAGVGPFVQQRLDGAFGFAVCAGPVRARAVMLDPELGEGAAGSGGDVAGAVVAHQRT